MSKNNGDRQPKLNSPKDKSSPLILPGILIYMLNLKLWQVAIAIISVDVVRRSYTYGKVVTLTTLKSLAALEVVTIDYRVVNVTTFPCQ